MCLPLAWASLRPPDSYIQQPATHLHRSTYWVSLPLKYVRTQIPQGSPKAASPTALPVSVNGNSILLAAVQAGTRESSLTSHPHRASHLSANARKYSQNPSIAPRLLCSHPGSPRQLPVVTSRLDSCSKPLPAPLLPLLPALPFVPTQQSVGDKGQIC